MTPRKPTAALTKEVAAFIRRGGYPHMAAEAAGIPVPVFEVWLKRAEQPRASSAYRLFAAEVRKAQAHARILAEVELFQSDPKTWLKSGPGRDQVDSPGWSTTAPPADHTPVAVNLVFDSALRDLWAALLDAVAPFPEARAALVGVLQHYDMQGRRVSDHADSIS